MSEWLKGSMLAEHIKETAAERIEKMPNPPGLAAILVGENTASRLYVSLKEKAAKKVGIYFETFEYEDDVPEKELIRRIHELNQRADIHGILVQLPLSEKHNEDAVIAAIDPAKDVDGFHPENREHLQKGEVGLVPPVALAVMRLISASHQPLAGKSAVIVSNNAIFAEPLVELMKEVGVEATYADPAAGGLEARTRVADIVVIAVGKRGFLTADMVKEGAIVIDVGANKDDEGKTVGDIADDVFGHAAFISPVPGGVGPLTVAYLLMNVIRAAEIQKRVKEV